MNCRNQILAIRSQTLQMIHDLTVSPKPTYKVENQSVSWESYLKQLQATVDWCNAQLAAEENVEICTIART